MSSKKYTKYISAGVIFTDGKILLAGYQPHKKNPCISGIGGKKKEGETYIITALREMLEELFEFNEIPKKLIKEIKSLIIPQKILENSGYIIIVYDFQDLEMILKIIKIYKLQSILYDKFPKNLMELIFNRKINSDSKCEISHLSLLPVIKHDKKNSFIDNLFIDDISLCAFTVASKKAFLKCDAATGLTTGCFNLLQTPVCKVNKACK